MSSYLHKLLSYIAKITLKPFFCFLFFNRSMHYFADYQVRQRLRCVTEESGDRVVVVLALQIIGRAVRGQPQRVQGWRQVLQKHIEIKVKTWRVLEKLIKYPVNLRCISNDKKKQITNNWFYIKIMKRVNKYFFCLLSNNYKMDSNIKYSLNF